MLQSIRIYTSFVVFVALLFTGLFAVKGVSLRAQEITLVAVLDYGAVLKAFSLQSQGLQRISDLKAEVKQEMERLKGQLQQLKKDLAKAEDKRKNREVQRIRSKITTQQDYGRKYLKSKNKEIVALQQENSGSSSNNNVQKILPNIISQVAREQGYSLIMDKNSQSIIWLDTAIDITEIVIRRMRNYLKK
ncbi:OmpH family outer membrane protein [Candidatus Haliotispira prima]|uniref:OmpH family outer membrane protein n=1 Tax=Candidatus Haliotispira prima TaxID=3034016 RepID=A0ABY8MFS0_9SPIO|nr:OmpH family outer membrane protein [Candidatus Haliotispira prima]